MCNALEELRQEETVNYIKILINGNPEKAYVISDKVYLNPLFITFLYYFTTKRRAPVIMTGAFFLGICINYPNGLFNSSFFQV